MTLEGVLIIVGTVVVLAGLITLIRPVPRLWISDRLCPTIHLLRDVRL
jgi:hypothetical protein